MTVKPDRVPLTDFCDIVQGGRRKQSGKDFVDTGYPAYGAGGINGYLPSYEFEKPAVILSAIGARCGKCFIPAGKWASLANTQLIFPDDDRADVRFLWYQLNDESHWHRSGTGQPFIKPSDVKNRLVYLPPLPEQKRIAAILDAADALRAKRRESIEQLDSLIQATFLEMFGDPVTNPKSWTDAVIGDLFHVKGGKRLPKGEEYCGSVSMHPYIRVSDLSPNRIDTEHLKYLRPETHARISRYIVRKDDVVISIAGTLGVTAPVPDQLDGANLTENAARITAKTGRPTEAVFLSHFLQTAFAQNQIQSQTGQVTIGKLALFRIEKLRIHLPPLDLQTRFASIVEYIEHQKAQMQAHLVELDALFSSLQSRAFNGELVA